MSTTFPCGSRNVKSSYKSSKSESNLTIQYCSFQMSQNSRQIISLTVGYRTYGMFKKEKKNAFKSQVVCSQVERGARGVVGLLHSTNCSAFCHVTIKLCTSCFSLLFSLAQNSADFLILYSWARLIYFLYLKMQEHISNELILSLLILKFAN